LSNNNDEQKFDSDYILQGLELMFQRKQYEAIEHFDKIPPTHPEYFNAIVNKASALSQLGFADEAQAEIDRLHPQTEARQIVLLMKKVRFYERANDSENAIKFGKELHEKLGGSEEFDKLVTGMKRFDDQTSVETLEESLEFKEVAE